MPSPNVPERSLEGTSLEDAVTALEEVPQLGELGIVSPHFSPVTYLGLGSSKDWELAQLIVERDYTFVTAVKNGPIAEPILPGQGISVSRCSKVGTGAV